MSRSGAPCSFSVIIPVRNGARTLGRCLEAVFNSVPRPQEVIVVNDGSTDQTRAEAARHPCRILDISLGLGPMQPRFAGASAAKGEILVFADADVEVPDGVLARLLDHFRDPAVDAASGVLTGDSPVLNFFSHFKNEYMNYIFSKKPRQSSFLYGSLFAVRAAVLKPFVPVNDPFGCLVSDSELGFRLCEAGSRVILDPECAVRHLKEYSLTGLLRNDFMIPFMFARIFTRYARRTPWINRRGFSHASVFQTLATAAAFGMFLMGVVAGVSRQGTGLWPGLLCGFYFAAYWTPFLVRLWKRRGAAFALKAAVLLPLDAAVMFAGMVAGFLWSGYRQLLSRLGIQGFREALCPEL